MGEGKHTPGPWRYDPIDHRVDTAAGWCTVFAEIPRGCDEEERHANGRLAAASPTMLAALRECAVTLQSIAESFNGEDMIDLSTDGVLALNRARAAIAAATGGDDA